MSLSHLRGVVLGVRGAGELASFDDTALHDGDEAAAVFEEGDVLQHVAIDVEQATAAACSGEATLKRELGVHRTEQADVFDGVFDVEIL